MSLTSTQAYKHGMMCLCMGWRLRLLDGAASGRNSRGVRFLPLSKELSLLQLPKTHGHLGAAWALLRIVLPAVMNQLPQLVRPVGWNGMPVTASHLHSTTIIAIIPTIDHLNSKHE